MTKFLDYLDIRNYDTHISIPRTSFIAVFDYPFINRHNLRVAHVQTMVFNVNLFCGLRNFCDRLKDYDYDWNIFFVYPGDIKCKEGDIFYFNGFKILHMCIKQLADYNILLGGDTNLFIFVGFQIWKGVLLSMLHYHDLTLSGGDVSRRHLINPLSIRLLDRVCCLTGFSLSELNKCGYRYNIPDKIVKPVDLVGVKNKDLEICKNFSSSESDTYFKSLEELGVLLRTSNLLSPQYKERSESRLNWTKLELSEGRKMQNSILKTRVKQVRYVHTTRLINSKFNVYDEIKYFLANNPKNHITQLKIEEYLLNHGISEVDVDKVVSGLHISVFREKTAKFVLQFHPILTKKITRFLGNHELYSSDIKSKTNPSYHLTQIISMVGIPFILKIISGRFLRILSYENLKINPEKTLTNEITTDITKDLLREYFYRLYKRKELFVDDLDYSYSEWKDENQSLVDFFKPLDIKIKIGAIIIEWMEDSNLINRTFVKIDKKAYNVITSSSNTSEEWKKMTVEERLTLSDKSENALSYKKKPIIQLASPFRLPSITPPKQYRRKDNGKYELGGYLLNDNMYAEEVIIENYNLKEQSRILDDNIVYDLINNVNSVAYKINTDLLTFIGKYRDYFVSELYDECYQHPWSKKVKLTKRERIKLQKYYSKLELQQHILNIAEVYSVLPEFYFVHRIDNRGRLYCITEYLNYQSVELAKALLLFSKPSQISRFGDESGVNYLKMYGANCFGNKIDKLSGNDKIAWVDSNLDNILNYENGKLITKADNKFLFTAFCIEFNRWLSFYHNSKDHYFNSYLPIQLDASCNGFQHLVLLSGESNLRKELNLTKTNYGDEPGDFYSYILGSLTDYLNKELLREDLSKEVRSSHERLKTFVLDRSLIKKMIMTIPYNATNFKITKDLKESLVEWTEKVGDEELVWLSRGKDKDPKLTYGDLANLTKNIKKVLDIAAPRVTRLKYYLTQVALICSALNLHIPWLLPNGLEVKQSYLETKEVKIKPFTFSKTKITLKMHGQGFNIRKQARAFMPNLIHSLDSSSLAILVNNYFKSDIPVKNIFTIHDCFAIPLNHIDFIIDNLRSIYLKIYSEDVYLRRLNSGIITHIKLHYGDRCYNELNNIIIIKSGDKEVTYNFPDIKRVLGENLTPPVLDEELRYILV